MRTVIQYALVNAGKAGVFYPVLYDAVDGAQLKTDDMDDLVQIAPSSVEANEVRAAFEIDGRRGHSFGVDRTGWQFEMILRFSQEVSLTAFEESINANPICIPRGDDMPRQARLVLSSASYTHPPRKGASNGTEAKLRFNAVLSPL
jgi:hypothetical protein